MYDTGHACITFAKYLALILKFSTTIKPHCKSLANLIKRKNMYIQLLHFCIALSRLAV